MSIWHTTLAAIVLIKVLAVHNSTQISLEAAVTSLSHSVFGKEESFRRCVVIHVINDLNGQVGPVGSGSEQVVILDANTLSKNLVQIYAKWLKTEPWCAVAVVKGEGFALKGALKLLIPVRNSLVVVYGKPDYARVKAINANTKIVWFEETKSKQAYLHVKCPTVNPTSHSFHARANIWSIKQETFVTQAPAIISCKNPMFKQHLLMTHNGGRRIVIHSEETGLPIRGRIYRMFQLFSEIYHFTLEAALAAQPEFHPGNMTWGGSYGLISNGHGFGTVSLWQHVMYLFFDLTVPHDIMELIFISRKPKPIDTYDNLLKPFSPGVWLASGAALTTFGILSLTAYKTYLSTPNSQQLVRKESSFVNFIMYPYVKITEPEALPWFPCWSTGKLLIFQWTIMSAFLVMFYSCNLLAHLTAVDLEKPIDTLQDILDIGDTPYIYKSNTKFSKSLLEATGQIDSIHYQISQLTEKRGGFIEFGLSSASDMLKMFMEVLENRASILAPRNNIPLIHLDTHGYLKRRDMHAGREIADQGHECLMLRKYNPATPYLDKVIRRATEAGLPGKYLMEHIPVEEAVDMKSPNPSQAMTIKTFSLALIMFATGTMVAKLLFVFEMGYLSLNLQEVRVN